MLDIYIYMYIFIYLLIDWFIYSHCASFGSESVGHLRWSNSQEHWLIGRGCVAQSLPTCVFECSNHILVWYQSEAYNPWTKIPPHSSSRPKWNKVHSISLSHACPLLVFRDSSIKITVVERRRNRIGFDPIVEHIMWASELPESSHVTLSDLQMHSSGFCG